MFVYKSPGRKILDFNGYNNMSSLKGHCRAVFRSWAVSQQSLFQPNGQLSVKTF